MITCQIPLNAFYLTTILVSPFALQNVRYLVWLRGLSHDSKRTHDKLFRAVSRAIRNATKCFSFRGSQSFRIIKQYNVSVAVIKRYAMLINRNEFRDSNWPSCNFIVSARTRVLLQSWRFHYLGLCLSTFVYVGTIYYTQLYTIF